MREPGDFKLYLKLWFAEDPFFRELLIRPSKELQSHQDIIAWITDYFHSTYAVQTDRLRSRCQYVATSNWFYKWFFNYMIYPAIEEQLNRMPRHRLPWPNYWTISPSGAGDICEHLCMRALETGRFIFAEAIGHLYIKWQYDEATRFDDQGNLAPCQFGPTQWDFPDDLAPDNSVYPAKRRPSNSTEPTVNPIVFAPDFNRDVEHFLVGIHEQSPSIRSLADQIILSLDSDANMFSMDTPTPAAFLEKIMEDVPELKSIIDNYPHLYNHFLSWVEHSSPEFKAILERHRVIESELANRQVSSERQRVGVLVDRFVQTEGQTRDAEHSQSSAVKVLGETFEKVGFGKRDSLKAQVACFSAS